MHGPLCSPITPPVDTWVTPTFQLLRALWAWVGRKPLLPFFGVQTHSGAAGPYRNPV